MVIRQILHLLLIQKHSVRRKRHLDFFIVFLLLLANIGHRLLHHMPVHERFTAEKVQLAMFTVSAVGDEEINSPARHIEAHEHTPLSISSLSGKAVLAAEIAVVGDIDTQRLDNRFIFDRHFIILIHGRIKRLSPDEFIQIIHDFIQLFSAVFFFESG